MKKGFTLIELLAVIVVLALLTIITIISVNSTIYDSREKLSNAKKSEIEDAARVYYLKEGEENTDCINLSTLTSKGYIEKTNLKDPNTGKKMNGSVKITYEENKYKYEYSEEQCVIAKDFSTDSWETIAAAFSSGSYEGIYKVGNTKTIDMGDLGIHTVRIANLSTPEECDTEGYSQTACGVVIEFVDIITKYNMNLERTNRGGYPATELYTFIESEIYPSLPEELKNIIINTYVVSGHGSDDLNTNRTDGNWESTDQLYLLSPMEVYGTSFTKSTDTSNTTTHQLDYYSNNNVTTSNYSLTIKKLNDAAWSWWFRSAYYVIGSISQFFDVSNKGNLGTGESMYLIGISPAFRLASE